MTPKDLTVTLICRQSTNRIYRKADLMVSTNDLNQIPKRFRLFIEKVKSEFNITPESTEMSLNCYDYMKGGLYKMMFNEKMQTISRKIDANWIKRAMEELDGNRRTLPFGIGGLIMNYASAIQISSEICVKFEKINK